jgi:hypothetical protein
VERQRGLAGRLGTVDLGDAPPGDAPHTGGGVEIDGPGWNGRYLDPGRLGSHPHDGSLSELLLDLRDGKSQGLPAIGFEPGFISSHCVLVVSKK